MRRCCRSRPGDGSDQERAPTPVVTTALLPSSWHFHCHPSISIVIPAQAGIHLPTLYMGRHQEKSFRIGKADRKGGEADVPFLERTFGCHCRAMPKAALFSDEDLSGFRPIRIPELRNNGVRSRARELRLKLLNPTRALGPGKGWHRSFKDSATDLRRL